MANVGKRGSSRRKGDEYQDLTALRLALEHYIAQTPFQMYLEFERSGNLDDIVLFRDTQIDAYQVRYSVSSLALYCSKDLTDPESRTYLRKFSESWAGLHKRFPQHRLTAHRTRRMKTRESELGGAAPKVCSQTRRKLAKSRPSKPTFRPIPVSCGITERSLLCSIKSSLMRDFRVRSPLPVARPAADLSQPCARPVGLLLATRSPGVGSQSCGAKYPRFCADSKGV